MCNKYIQIFKKIARRSRYGRRPLIEEFKRGLSRVVKRRLAEAESLLLTNEEWQERVVKLNRNMRQSWVEKRILGAKGVVQAPGAPNVQQLGGQYPFWGPSTWGGFGAQRGQGF